MSSGFFRGTTHDQDSRFGNIEKKLMQKMVFDPVVEKKVGRRGGVYMFKKQHMK